MHVGIISDTHDNVAAVERAAEAFRERGVETVLHCGDVIAPPVLPFFEGFEVHAVIGNNDGELDGLESGLQALGGDSALHGRFLTITLDDTRFAILHGEELDEVEELAASGEYDFVCYGHHHEAEQRDVDGTTVLNPGGHFPTIPAEHRSVAVVDTADHSVEFVNVAE